MHKVLPPVSMHKNKRRKFCVGAHLCHLVEMDLIKVSRVAGDSITILTYLTWLCHVLRNYLSSFFIPLSFNRILALFRSSIPLFLLHLLHIAFHMV
jgi:hypothetical protein